MPDNSLNIETITFGSDDRRTKYRLFVSHSWDYSDEYENLTDLLDEANHFKYMNHSIPEEEEIDADTDEELEEELREGQIKPASVVIALAGLYSSYSDWISREIRIAEDEDKPILGVEPWGSGSTSNYVERHADQVVGWNTDSIVEAIRNMSP
ncbi:TIR domain-containing protein [Haloarcula argentinensis]|uniref:TIR domain-containing protein n=1 Tax=Haloarcula argentinensis TaxID=43776 RepID=A0A847UHE5_HALAR|nr:TIR domain-containing protein [Haloarcula argentinensis]NLV15203.1 TIR domain-containing protein [Haloarcula argentinensis]